MSATFWKVFELAISVLENMLLLGFAIFDDALCHDYIV